MDTDFDQSDIDWINNYFANLENKTEDILYNVNVKPYNDDLDIKDKAVSLARSLEDIKNLNFYKRLICNCDLEVLFESLEIVLVAKNQNRINTTPAKYFVGVLKYKGVNW